MKQMTFTGLLLMALVMTFGVLDLHCVGCKTLQLNSTRINSVVKNQSRKFDNFVDFTDEGDQLAVESSGSVIASATDNKKGILGTETSMSSTTGRECANVQKAVYPVIPVIIASLVGLIGSIIISAIVRLIFKKKKEKDSEFESSSEYGVPGYGRRVSKGNLFGFDWRNFNFARLTNNVLAAIEKVY